MSDPSIGSRSFDELYDILNKIATPEIAGIIASISEADSYLRLPETDSSISVVEASKLVAATANHYSEAVRIAGLLRAILKLAEARYKQTFKSALADGKNENEREANATRASANEFEAVAMTEALVRLAESIEMAARVSSESARRMMLGAEQGQMADARELRSGAHAESFADTY